ncbi:MAG: hypothetical protein ABFS34_07700 [Gemmatimonadota bacterium]
MRIVGLLAVATASCGGGITDSGEDNQSPTVVVLSAPAVAAVALPVAFTVLATDPNEAPGFLLERIIAQYGDGAVDTAFVGGDSTQVTFSHTYPTVGGRTVTFTAEDLEGLSGQTSTAISIIQPDPAVAP